MDPKLWNEDGTPKRPVWSDMEQEASPFVELAAQDQNYINYARLQREAKANTPAGVADLVHYWHGDKCHAAIVTGDWSLTGEVDLTIFGAGSLSLDKAENVDHDEEKAAYGTWHWPESL